MPVAVGMDLPSVIQLGSLSAASCTIFDILTASKNQDQIRHCRGTNLNRPRYLRCRPALTRIARTVRFSAA
jgi:hypothetical protein